MSVVARRAGGEPKREPSFSYTYDRSVRTLREHGTYGYSPMYDHFLDATPPPFLYKGYSLSRAHVVSSRLATVALDCTATALTETANELGELTPASGLVIELGLWANLDRGKVQFLGHIDDAKQAEKFDQEWQQSKEMDRDPDLYRTFFLQWYDRSQPHVHPTTASPQGAIGEIILATLTDSSEYGEPFEPIVDVLKVAGDVPPSYNPAQFECLARFALGVPPYLPL